MKYILTFRRYNKQGCGPSIAPDFNGTRISKVWPLQDCLQSLIANPPSKHNSAHAHLQQAGCQLTVAARFKLLIHNIVLSAQNVIVGRRPCRYVHRTGSQRITIWLFSNMICNRGTSAGLVSIYQAVYISAMCSQSLKVCSVHCTICLYAYDLTCTPPHFSPQEVVPQSFLLCPSCLRTLRAHTLEQLTMSRSYVRTEAASSSIILT